MLLEEKKEIFRDLRVFEGRRPYLNCHTKRQNDVFGSTNPTRQV